MSTNEVSARALPPLSDDRHQSTGADRVFDWVSTPATVVPGWKSPSSKSVRFLYLMPAAAVANLTPSTAGTTGMDFGAKGETCMGVVRAFYCCVWASPAAGSAAGAAAGTAPTPSKVLSTISILALLRRSTTVSCAFFLRR